MKCLASISNKPSAEMEQKLVNTYETLLSQGLTEQQAGYHAVHSYYKELATDLNTLKTQLGLPTETVTEYQTSVLAEESPTIEEDGSSEEDRLKNAYFDIHWAVLMHKEMTQKILNPLDKVDLKEEAALIEKWNKTEKATTGFFDPVFQLQDFQSQKDAKQLVALASLSTTFNAVIQDKNLQIGMYDMTDAGLVKVPSPIYIIDENGVKRELVSLSGNAKSTYIDKDGVPHSRSKHDNHTTAQSEFLDYAKNKISDKVHLNTYTYAASAALTQLQTQVEPEVVAEGQPRLGSASTEWAASLSFNARLLSQPIIKEYVAEMAKGGDSLSVGYNPNLKDEVIAALLDKYGGKPIVGIIASFEDLTAALEKGEQFEYFEETQISAIELFQELDAVGTEMIKAQSLINHDTNGAGVSMLKLMTKEKTRANMTGPNDGRVSILGLNELFTDTEQGNLYSIIHNSVDTIVGEFFPYRKLMPIYESLMVNTKRTELSLDTQKVVFNAMKSYIFSHPSLGLWENPEALRATLLYSRNGKPSLAERVQIAQNTWGQKNYLLQRLTLNIDPDGLHPSSVSYLASKASKMDDSGNTRAWLGMLRSENAEQRELAEDLIKYAYVTGGLQDANSFLKFVPHSYLLGTDFGFRLREVTSQIEDTLVANPVFETQLIQHQPQLAAAMSEDLRELGGLEEYPERFTLNPIDPNMVRNPNDPNPAKKFYIKKPGMKGYTYPDYISYRSVAEGNKWILYMRVGIENSSRRYEYVRIDTLGDKNTDEYSYGIRSGKRSLVPENRAKYFDNTSPAEKMINGAMNPETMGIKQDLQMPASGGTAEIKGVLRGLETDPTVPQHVKLVAKFLADTDAFSDSTEFAGSPEFTFTAYDSVEGYEAEVGQKWSAANMHTGRQKRKLSVNLKRINSRGQLGEILNHELIHDRTAILTRLTETDEVLKARGYTEDEIVTLREHQKIAEEKYPEAMKAIAQLNNVRKQAESVLRTVMQQHGYDYDAVLKDVFAGKTENPFTRYVYAVSNTTEFITHALTDVKVMKFLNSHQFEGGNANFLSKVLALIKDMLVAIGDAMGFPVTSNSLLEKAIIRSMDVMTTRKAIEYSASDLSSPNNMAREFSDSALAGSSNILTAADRLIGKLEEQKDDIIHAQTGRLSPEEAADKRVKIETIEEDIQSLKDDYNLVLVGEIGKKHLGWIDTIVKQPNPTDSQIMTASRVLSVWASLTEIMYGDDRSITIPDPTFAKIAQDAISHRTALESRMKTLIKEESAGVLVQGDFDNAKIMDMTRYQSMPRALSSAVSNKLTRYVATFIETVARQRDEEDIRLAKFSMELEKDMVALNGGNKDLSEFYKKFLQENSTGTAWGLVQRFSQDWYDFRNNARVTRQAHIEMINKAGHDPKVAGKLKQKAWQDYWTKINSAAIFADTRWLFDPLTGELKTDEDSVNHQTELVNEIGEAAAKELIKGAQERFKKYLEEKEAHSANIDLEVIAGNMSEDEASIQKSEFEYKNSPNVFFNNFKSPDGKFRDMNSDYYTKMAPRRSINNGKFYDAKYDEIQANDKLKDIYDRYRTKIRELRNMLPIHIQKKLGANWLPIVNKAMVDGLSWGGVKEYVKTLDKKLINKITASRGEEGAEKVSRIPLDYIDADKVPLEERSSNLIAIMETFGSMAQHYKHFAEAKDFIDMSEKVLEAYDRELSAGNVQVRNSNGDLVTVEGNLKHTLAAFKYLRDYTMYKKSKRLQGNTEIKLYSVLNPRKQARIAKEVKALILEKTALDEAFAEGSIDPMEYMEKLKAVDEKLDNEEYQGRNVYGSKLGDQLIRFNQLKTLAFNPFSAVANITFGMLSAWVHANGRRDFNKKELAQAHKMTSHAFAKWLSFGTVESKMAYKMHAIMDRTGIIGDFVDTRYGKVKMRDRKPGWQRRLNPFAMMQSTDYFMKTLTTNAMLLHEKVDVVENGVPKTVTLFEALNDEGEWNAERFGENKEWSSEEVKDQTKWDKFRNRAVRVNIIVHGNQDSNSPKLANNSIVGRLLGQFRLSWLPEGWNARFQSEDDDIQLGRKVKGRYLTLKDLGFVGSAKMLLQQTAGILFSVDPFTGVTYTNGKKLLEVDIENMRRNLAELGFIVTIATAVFMLRHMRDDDDDDGASKSTLQLLINLGLRSQQDLQFYSSPDVFNNITRNIIPAAQVFTDAWGVVKAATRYMTESEYEEAKLWKAIFRAGLPIPQATLVNKMDYMINKDLGDLQH